MPVQVRLVAGDAVALMTEKHCVTTNQLNFDTKRFSLYRKDGSKPSIPVYLWMVLSDNLTPRQNPGGNTE